jgi:two-component system CheB/CheR fusion protein
VGLGTTVSFTIPSDQSRVHIWDKKDSVEFPLKNDFILLVDDSSDLRLLMRMLLERVGARIVEASTVAEAEVALGQAESLPFNVVITDIDMPVEDGFVLLDHVRNSLVGKNVPVIALTGFSAPEEIEKIMKAGFDLCFTKPVDFEKLVQAVQQLLHPIVRSDDTKRKEVLLLKPQEL